MKSTSSRPPGTAVPAARLEQLCAEYRRYLVEERGLVPLTVDGYLKTAGVALARWCGDDSERLEALGAGDVSGFVLSESRRGLSPRTVNEIVVRVRSLLRFLHLQGYVTTPLAQAAPWLAGSREQSLPRALDPAVGKELTDSCHASRPTGTRDRAWCALGSAGPRGGTTFFVDERSGPVHYPALRAAFAEAVSCTGRRWEPPPRLGDFRHGFATRTLLGWYRAGEDVQAMLPRLSRNARSGSGGR